VVPVEITATVKQAHWTCYATGPGVGIQTVSGRLVVPATHAVTSTAVHRSHVIVSDDGGTSWQLGGSSDPGTNESQVVELADGRLMLNMRNHPPKPANYRMVATYSSLVALPARAIGLLFERGERTPYETITFARLTLTWLTAGTDR
jgi:hypothetical protein